MVVVVAVEVVAWTEEGVAEDLEAVAGVEAADFVVAQGVAEVAEEIWEGKFWPFRTLGYKNCCSSKI